MAVEKKIGLLGGSFDPVHNTHIALALAARNHLELDSVELIPAANPWQKQALTANVHHRIAMLKLACAAHPWLKINTIETDRGGKTYTIDTLRALPPMHQYFWIMGSDQLQNFCTWHKWKEISQRVTLAVALRPGNDINLPSPLESWLNEIGRVLAVLPFTPNPISASQIRNLLANQQQDIDGLHPDVLHYIHKHHLYQTT